mgnify:CR=1 FL=1
MNIKKLGVNASYFYADPLVKAVRRIIKCGFRRIEFTGLSLTSLSDSDLKELGTLLKHENAECVSINTAGELVPINLGNLAMLHRREREKAVSHVKQCIDFAVELGCQRVVCDLGMSTEEKGTFSFDEEQERYLSSCRQIIEHASACKVTVVLMNVPGARWKVWEGLPPDKVSVVERHVPPWRLWPDEKELIEKTSNSLNNSIRWAFDTANTVVAHGADKFDVIDTISLYLKHGLEIVYLANHPGLYNKVWHRLLLHQPLWQEGFYTAGDYASLFTKLTEARFNGEIILQIRDEEPSEESLLKNINLL